MLTFLLSRLLIQRNEQWGKILFQVSSLEFRITSNILLKINKVTIIDENIQNRDFNEHSALLCLQVTLPFESGCLELKKNISYQRMLSHTNEL